MIGSHVVTMTPDPDSTAWGPVLASNANFAADLVGWKNWGFTLPWVWEAPGYARGQQSPLTSVLIRDPAYPVHVDGSTLYRVRARFMLTVPGYVTLSVKFGRTAAEASGYQTPAILREQWFWQPTTGVWVTLEAVFDATTIPPEYGFITPQVNLPTPAAGLGPALDSLEINGQAAGTIDLSCLVDEVSIEHGRADTTGQPEASSATISLSLDTADTELPDTLEIGSLIRVVTTFGDNQSVRFVGSVTDVSITWEEAAEDTPNAVAAQVIATNVLATLGRRVVGSAPWPQELDGARVSRIMAAAGVALDPLYSDPGKVQILARDVDAQPALVLAQSVAQSASGLLWATRSGEVRYADSEHRRNTAGGLDLDACDVLVTPMWQRTTDGLINAVNVIYGVAPEGGERPSYAATNAASQTRYGRYDVSTTTELAALADAQAMATLLLTRNSFPVWLLRDLPVDVAGLSEDDTANLLSLDVNDLVRVTGLPVAGSLPTTTSLWVEGWTEALAAGSHEITLHVSGYCRTSPPPRWDDLPSVMTWDTVRPDLTWDGASCVGPIPSEGRWNDVPASLRWNGVPPTTTWDTWKG